MPFREGLIAGRGQILWIVLLALSSALILHFDLAHPPHATTVAPAPAQPSLPPVTD